MAPAKTKKSRTRVKKDPGAVSDNGKKTVRTGHMVFVSHVPSALCASERTVRDLFSEYGVLLSVSIHHNFLDMEPDGFMYLEYAEKEEAEAAVAAVKEKTVGLAASTDTKFKPAVHPATITEMQAVLSLRRGEPKLEANEELKDLLLGRQLFSQSQQEQTMDEDDLILQSLSQHSFASSQQTKKKKKRRSSGEPSKKSKKSRSNRVAIPTE